MSELDYVARGPLGDRMTAGELEHVSPTDAMLRQLQAIAWLLDRSSDVVDFSPAAIVVSDEPHQVLEQLNWPIVGGRRWVVGTQGFGTSYAIGAGTVVDVLPAQIARIGGMLSIPATGSPSTVFLGPAKAVAAGQAVPQIALPVGGQWDFKLGNVLWGGSVSVGAVAASVAVVAVV